MKKRTYSMVIYFLFFGAVALFVLAPPALADFTGPYESQNWSSNVINGPLDVSINPVTGPSPFMEFSYDAPLPYDYQLRIAAFKTVATHTGKISFDWEYDYFHCWYLSYRTLKVYADGPSGKTVQTLVDGYDGPMTLTGSASIDVIEGYEFGIEVGGSHYDESQTLKGTVTLTNFGVPVNIDIKPGIDPNKFKADGNGVIPIAILGSDNLNAEDLDPSTLSFEGASVHIKGSGDTHCSLDDVNSDNYPDLVCFFYDEFFGGWLGNDIATVTGNLYDGAPIFGSDTISIIE